MNENIINNSINCSKCGTKNMATSKFCIRCGNVLQGLNVNNNQTNQYNNQNMEMNSINQYNNQNMEMNSTNQYNNQNMEMNSINQYSNQNMEMNSTNQYSNQNAQSNYNVSNSNINEDNMNYLTYMVNAILKPYETFKKEENNLLNFKNTGILVAIVTGIITIFNLISTIITSVRVTSFWSDEVEWVWENLKEIEYFKIIGQNMLIYAGIIFAISGVYFLASLVIKNETKFVKILSAVTTSFIPLAISISILSPLLSLINTTLGLIIVAISFIYFIIILLELVNDQIIIENKNTRIYFHVICLSILVIGGAFVVYKVLLESLSSGLDFLSF